MPDQRRSTGEGEEIRIPVSEEQVKVEKKPVVTGEVDVHKEVVQENKEVQGQVRREQVKVERKGDVNVKSDDQDDQS